MKKILKSIWFILFISILFINCETEEEITTSETKINKKNENTATNSPQEGKVKSALFFLNKHFQKKPNSVNRRSNRSLNDYSQNTIDTIYNLNDKNNNPLLKLVVFKRNSYALISNIENVDNPAVLFYSSEKFEKENINPVLIDYIDEFINSHSKDGMAPNDSQDKNGDGAWDDGRDTGGTGDPRDSPYYRAVVEHWTETNEKGALLSTYWSQETPYNKKCPKINGKSTPVGCVAIAIGQIMNYHRKNTMKNYNWDKINAKPFYNSYFDNGTISDEIAKFLHDIGLGVKMDYRTDGSGANVKDAVKYFKSAGYQANLQGYNYEKFKESIDNSKPVYLRGNSKRKGIWFIVRWGWNYSGGHAWVGDGYKEITQWEKIEQKHGNNFVYTQSKVKTTKYIHMNWGWGRQSGSDGWCTYDYWRATDKTEYKYNKKMISVTPNR